MKPSSGKKIIIDHFKGLSDYPTQRGRQYRDYAPKSLGVMDLTGANLLRIGGAIAADSVSCPSVWTLAQLRFRDRWGILVAGATRELYNPGTPYINTPINFGDIDATREDWQVRYDYGEVPDPGSDPTGVPEHLIHPSVCHSWWSLKWGTFEYPITDATVYVRHRANAYHRIEVSSCAAMKAAILADILNGFAAGVSAAGWSDWHLDNAADTHSYVAMYNIQPAGGGNWNGQGLWKQCQWTIVSAMLANADPASYPYAFLMLGTMELDMADFVGDDRWAQVPQNSPGPPIDRPDDCPNREAGMILTDATIPESAEIAAGLAGCAGESSGYVHQHDYTSGEDSARLLSNVKGVFETHESHMGGG